MPALGTRPHIYGGSTRRGRAPPEDPPRGSRGSLEPATSLMTGGAALSVPAETERARGVHERLARGALLSAPAGWSGPREGKQQMGRIGVLSPVRVLLLSLFFYFSFLLFPIQIQISKLISTLCPIHYYFILCHDKFPFGDIYYLYFYIT
jgi:hypothetical protein